MTIANFLLNFEVFLLVLARMMGLFLFCPIFGRKNVPNVLKAGLALTIAILVHGHYAQLAVDYKNIIVFSLCILKEFAVGYTISVVLQTFMTVFHFGGAFIDYQIGYSFASALDPASSINLTIIANMLNIMFILTFFISGAYLSLVKFAALSFEVLSPDRFSIDANTGFTVVRMLGTALTYALQLTMPVLAVELTTEIGVGVMMKAVPQINVFVVNIQLKLILGILTILMTIPILGGFITRVIELALDNIEIAVFALAG